MYAFAVLFGILAGGAIAALLFSVVMILWLAFIKRDREEAVDFAKLVGLSAAMVAAFAVVLFGPAALYLYFALG